MTRLADRHWQRWLRRPGLLLLVGHAVLNGPSVATNEQESESQWLDAGAAPRSLVIANTYPLTAGSRLLQTNFDSGDWSGHLLARPIAADGHLGDAVWDAANLIPDPAQRAIWTGNPDAPPETPKGIPFLWENLTSAQQAALNQDGAGHPDPADAERGADRLAYLRGERRHEQQQGGDFRNRNTLLGSIVHSQPAVTGNFDYGYDRLPDPEGPSYAAHRNSSRPAMIYVGANDGMLHGFDAGTGTEQFAYVPNAAFPRLSRLVTPDYSHAYTVDGSPWVGDAYIGNRWRQVLVGTQGLGGRSLFTLDVSSPADFAAEDVLWEFTAPDLGLTLPEPTVARLANGAWMAIIGNGYHSDSHEAVLLLIDLADGVAVRLPTGVGSSSEPNGLGAPVAVDSNGDRIVEAIYAGDLQGNLWKFDVSAGSNGQWRVAFAGSPLIKVIGPDGSPQPITARPDVGRHPQGGLMVYFGTGRFFAAADSTDTRVQTFYGIRDQGSAVNLNAGNRSEKLQRQTIIHELSVSGSTARLTDDNLVNWETQHGWCLDLVPPGGGDLGERVISAPWLRFGRVIFTTITPSSDGSGGTSWLMELTATTGSRPGQAVIDLNGDQAFTTADLAPVPGQETILVPVSGKRSTIGMVTRPAVLSAQSIDYKYTGGANGTWEKYVEKGAERGRQSWRQLE